MRWAMWGLGASCYLAALFHRMSLSVAGLTAQQRFGIDATGLAVFAAVQLALYAALQIPVGSAADRFGPRRLILLGMTLMAAGAAVFGAATGFGLAVAGRALVGAGDALMFVSVLLLARNWFPGNRYALVAALTGMLGGLGQLVATAPLGALLAHAGWTTTFLTASGVTAVLMLVAAAVLRERPAGSATHAQSMPLRATLCEVWRSRGTRHALWTHFTLMGAFVSVTAALGQPYLVGAHSLSRDTAAILLAVAVLGFVAGSTAAGRAAGAKPELRGSIALASALAITTSLLVLVAAPGPAPLPVLGFVLFVLGAAGGTSMVAFDLARTANLPQHSGAASGIVNVGGFSFAVTAQLTTGLLLDALHTSGMSPAPAHRLAFAPVLALAVAGTVLIARSRRHAGTPERQADPLPAERQLVTA